MSKDYIFNQSISAKKIRTSSATPSRSSDANYQSTKSPLNSQERKKNFAPHTGQGFYTREQQIAVRNTTRHARFKKKSASEGKSFFLRALFLPGFPNEKMPLDICDEDFSFKNKPTEMKFSFKEESFLIKEIEKLLEKGVIRESINVEGDFISPISPPDPFRLILNLKWLNFCLTCFINGDNKYNFDYNS